MKTKSSHTRVSRSAVEEERRGSASRFDSLLKVQESKTTGGQREPGTGTAVLYLRVSTQRQLRTATDIDPDGNSIATQREATMKRAKRLKVPIAEVFVEPGHSAQSIANRPVFRDLLHYIEEHPEVTYVIIYMRSRVFRNQTDAAITKRILASMDVKLISAKEEFGEGYMADAMEAITDIMNEVQVRQSGEDISTKMLNKAKSGGTTGRAKLGYLNVRREVDGYQVNAIAIDPKRAPLMQWAFEQYATGDYSLVQLLHELTELGLTTRRTAKWAEQPLSRTRLAELLRDPYYIGMVPYKGEVYPGRHEALISPELFQRVQEVMDARMQRTQRDMVHNHYLRGMLECGRCKAKGRRRQLIYSRVSKGEQYTYEYFMCAGRQDGTCDLPHLPVALVEEAIQEEVDRLRLTPTEIAGLRDDAARHMERRLGAEKETHARARKELADLDVKEQRLLDLAAEGTLAADTVRERIAKYQVQRAGLRQRLEDTAGYIRQETETLLDYLTLLETPAEFYDRASERVKRKLLKAYFTHIWLDDDDREVAPTMELQPTIAQVRVAAHARATNGRGTASDRSASRTQAETPGHPGLFLSKHNLVRPRGLEPLASCSGGKRSIR